MTNNPLMDTPGVMICRQRKLVWGGERRDTSPTHLGMQASAINTKSILHASTGMCFVGKPPSGAKAGYPPVSSRSTRSCRWVSHLFGSPIKTTTAKQKVTEGQATWLFIAYPCWNLSGEQKKETTG